MGATFGWCLDQAKGKKRPVPKEKNSNSWRNSDEDEEKDTGFLPTEAELPELDRNWVVEEVTELAEVE